MCRTRHLLRALLSLPIVLALAVLVLPPPAAGFHFPWDQGHDTFQPEDDGDGDDPGEDSPCQAGSPFEPATGNYVYFEEDLVIPGPGPDLAVLRSYNSRDRRAGLFGVGWSFGLEARVAMTTDGESTKLVYRKANGKRARLTLTGGEGFVSDCCYSGSVEELPEGGFVLTERNGYRRLFNADGSMVGLLDRNGNGLKISHNDEGAIVAVTDSAGRSMTLSMAANGKVETIVDPAGGLLRYAYNSAGDLVSFTDRMGAVRRYEYDAKHNLTKVIDERGNIVQQMTYDQNDRVTSYLENGEKWTVAYDVASRRTTKTDSRGRSWLITYNSRGSVSSIRDPFGSTESYEYDAHGNIVRRTDKNGNQTVYTFDERGNNTSVTDAVGKKTAFEHLNNLPLVAKVTDPLGSETNFEYDQRGNLVTVKLPNGKARAYSYDEHGMPTGLSDENGRRTTYLVDKHGYLTTIVDSQGNVSRIAYDILGRIVRVENRERHVSTFEYDRNGNMTLMKDKSGALTAFEYDSAGNLLRVLAPNGGDWRFTYDANNRLVRRTSPDGAFESYSYDSAGNLLSFVNARGQATTYEYDGLRRVTKISAPDNITFYTYDRNGNKLSASDSDSTLTFAYDSVNRVVSATSGGVGTHPAAKLSYSYDARGLPVSITDDKGGSTRYEFDELLQMSRVITSTGATIDMKYSARGEREKTLFPNGTYSEYDRDASGKLRRIVHGFAGAQSIVDSYEFDSSDNIAKITSGSRIRRFSYDASQRLIAVDKEANDESYSYGVDGARSASHLSASYRANIRGQIIEDDLYSYAYDMDGNLSVRTEKVSGQQTRYFFDSSNRLIRIETPGGGVASYRYDALGRRFEKTVNGKSSRFVYDNSDIIMELDAEGAVVARFVHGNRVDQPLWQKRGDREFYYHSDHLGSIRALSDSFGNVVAEYEYEGFGLSAGNEISEEVRYGFVGRERDGESGFYYLRARYYDPRLGSFVSEDGFMNVGGEGQLYTYAFNNPLRYTDPSGRSVLAPTWGAFIADVFTPEPTDAAWPKWVGWGAALGGAALADWLLSENSSEDGSAGTGEGASEGAGESCPVKPPADPSKPPGEGWEWRGKGPPGSGQGSWYNPKTGESLHPDLNHGPPIGPHWDYNRPGGGKGWRVPPEGGIMTPK